MCVCVCVCVRVHVLVCVIKKSNEFRGKFHIQLAMAENNKRQ